MGVAGFFSIMKETASKVNLQEVCQGKPIALDAGAMIQRGLFGNVYNNAKQSSGDVKTSLFFVGQSYLKKCAEDIMGRLGCPMLYMVFDGSSPAIKEKCVQNRKNKFGHLFATLNGNSVESIIHKVVDLLIANDHGLQGKIMIIRAKVEADSQMVRLQKEGLAELIFTEDSDAILFGGLKVICKYRPGNLHADMYELSKVLNLVPEYRLTLSTLRMAALLSGDSDYSHKKLKNLGFRRSLFFVGIFDGSYEAALEGLGTLGKVMNIEIDDADIPDLRQSIVNGVEEFDSQETYSMLSVKTPSVAVQLHSIKKEEAEGDTVPSVSCVKEETENEAQNAEDSFDNDSVDWGVPSIWMSNRKNTQ